jgi:tRNA (guanine-N7-)-methyltransferase
MRLRKKPWANELINNNLGKYVISKEMLEENPLPANENYSLEIGTGKGGFIVGMALKYPKINFIGIEQNTSAFGLSLKKIVNYESEIPNLKIINDDVNEIIDLFKDGTFTNIYLNFSDPWPKARHNKRRLTYPTTLKKYERIMQKGAKIIFKTDNEGLFEDSVIYFQQEGWNLELVDRDYQLLDSDVETEYEAKFRSLGQKIYRLIASKEN